MEGAGHTIIEDRYKRLAAERRLLQFSSYTAAFCTLLQAAVLNGIYVFQEVMPPHETMAACGLGILGFLFYHIGFGGGQAHRERLWLLRLAVVANLCSIGMAAYCVYVQSGVPMLDQKASYGDIVRKFQKFHPDLTKDRSLEALGHFLRVTLDVVSELLRVLAVITAVMFIKDKAMSKPKRT